jgi:hypothetical protein
MRAFVADMPLAVNQASRAGRAIAGGILLKMR